MNPASMNPYDRPAAGDEQPLRRYRVHLGHACVDVHAHDHSDAVRRARRRLADELPRMWDRIHSLEEHRFQVNRLE